MVAPVVAASALSGLFGLFGARRAEQREAAARAEAAADDKAALAEQREYDLNSYNLQRSNALSDYERQRADALSDQDQQFVRLRAAAEKGGFNPLAVFQTMPGAGQVSSFGIATPSLASSAVRSSSAGYIQPSNHVGAALSDAAMLIGNAWASSKNLKSLTKFNKAKETLQSFRVDATASLRPKTGGVYSKSETPRFGLGVAAGAARTDKPVEVPPMYLDRVSGYYAGGNYVPGVTGWTPNAVHQRNDGDAVAEVRGVTDYILKLPQQSRAVSDASGWTTPGKDYRSRFVPIPGTKWVLPWPKRWTADVTANGKIPGAAYMGGW